MMEDENENLGEDFACPDYACDERTKDGFVHVVVWIRGLTTSGELTFKGILPSIEKKPDNATVDVQFQDTSLNLTVCGTSGDMKWKNYKLSVEKLHYEIIPEESYHEVGTDSVILFLRKKEDRSWYPELHRGLDVPEEPEEDS